MPLLQLLDWYQRAVQFGAAHHLPAAGHVQLQRWLTHGYVIAAAAATAPEAPKFPLRADSYAPLETDLRERGWTRSLEAKGFDRSSPTVWIAEVLPDCHLGAYQFLLHLPLCCAPNVHIGDLLWLNLTISNSMPLCWGRAC